MDFRGGVQLSKVCVCWGGGGYEIINKNKFGEENAN